MAKTDPVLTRLRKICLALPDTAETFTWGNPHYRVAGKIFCGYGEDKGRLGIGFKLEKEHADTIIEDPRFVRASYVGHAGWVSMEAARIEDWDFVTSLILESYRLIAPKKSLARLASPAAPTPSGARAVGSRKPRKKA